MAAEEFPDLQRFEAIKAITATWKPWWQEIADYLFPGKAEISTTNTTPTDENTARLYDSTGMGSVQIAGTGVMSYTSPQDERWFVYKPPHPHRKNDRVQAWYSKMSEAALEALAVSNFYSQIHELHLDRVAFATAAFFNGEDEEGDEKGLFFRAEPIGTYHFTEDYRRRANSFWREMCYTARQAVEEYGYNNLPEKVRTAYDNPTKADSTTFNFVHAVYKRMERDPRSIYAEDKPWASCHYCLNPKSKVKESGFDRNPYSATRWAVWGKGPYGYGPGFQALPACRQASFLAQQIDMAAEKLVTPPLLIPAGFQGEVDTRAGGQTVFDPYQIEAIPREWATASRLQEGMLRLQAIQQEIKDHFMVDLFTLFTMEDKKMTAREVSERASERLIQFSPTFARYTEEVLTPVLRHVFSWLVRTERVERPPQEAMMRSPGGVDMLPEPKVAYLSRIALAIASMQNVGAFRTMEFLTPIAQLDPTVLDSFKKHTLIREFARNEGVPESWLHNEKEMKEIQNQRQQEAQAQAALEAADMAAGAAQKAGIKIA